MPRKIVRIEVVPSWSHWYRVTFDDGYFTNCEAQDELEAYLIINNMEKTYDDED